MSYFNLLEGEQIVEEISPSIFLRRYFFVSWFFATFIFFVMGYAILIPMLMFEYNTIFLLALFVLFIINMAIPFIFAKIAYSKFHYWITNKRVITKSGLIGYRVTSIPLERISDIVISRTFLETLCGISSLHIQSFAGQITRGSRIGSEGQLLAITNPESTQNKILNLVKEKRREENLSF